MEKSSDISAEELETWLGNPELHIKDPWLTQLIRALREYRQNIISKEELDACVQKSGLAAQILALKKEKSKKGHRLKIKKRDHTADLTESEIARVRTIIKNAPSGFGDYSAEIEDALTAVLEKRPYESHKSSYALIENMLPTDDE